MLVYELLLVELGIFPYSAIFNFQFDTALLLYYNIPVLCGAAHWMKRGAAAPPKKIIMIINFTHQFLNFLLCQYIIDDFIIYIYGFNPWIDSTFHLKERRFDDIEALKGQIKNDIVAL